MKKIMYFIVGIIILSGCQPTSETSESNGDKITKEQYIKHLNEKMSEVTKLKSISTKDPDKTVVQMNKILDDIIALEGPKKYNYLEKSLDKNFETLKGLMQEAADNRNNKDEYLKTVKKIEKLNEEFTQIFSSYMVAR